MSFTNEWINGSAAARYLCNNTNEAYVRRRYTAFSEHLKGETVLDIGCAYGFGTNLLAEKGFKVLGIDIDEEVIQRAKEKFPSLNFECRAAGALHLRNFDNYVASDVIQHVKDSKEMLNRWNQELNNAVLIGTIIETEGLSPRVIDVSVGILSMFELKKIFRDIQVWRWNWSMKHRFIFKVDRRKCC